MWDKWICDRILSMVTDDLVVKPFTIMPWVSRLKELEIKDYDGGIKEKFAIFL